MIINSRGIESVQLRDPEGIYTPNDVRELLARAVTIGFTLERGSDLDGLTVRQLDSLVCYSRQMSMELADA